MKLKDLRKLSTTLRNVKFALFAVGAGMVVAMGAWCYMFQSDILNTVQWVLLELTTMCALVIDAFVFEFFREMNSEVQHRLMRGLARWHKKKQAKAAAIAAAAKARAALTESTQNDETAEPQEHLRLRVVNG